MQVVEVTDPGVHLGLFRGFLQVKRGDELIGRVVLDDIEAVIVSVIGCSLSTNLLDALAARNIPMSFAGSNYLPTTMLLPIAGKDRQFQTMVAQINAKRPLQKRVWQQVVKQKILNQAQVLTFLGLGAEPLIRLAKTTQSGDKSNCEAQAARYYWRALMGSEFRRDRDAAGENAALNYVYAVIRASMARAVVAAGLHPTLSLHHKNPQNIFNLVDDLMEPYRVFGDWLVVRGNYSGELDPAAKTQLATVVTRPAFIGDERSPVSQACLRTARSLAHVYLGEQSTLALPTLPTPIEMEGR